MKARRLPSGNLMVLVEGTYSMNWWQLQDKRYSQAAIGSGYMALLTLCAEKETLQYSACALLVTW